MSASFNPALGRWTVWVPGRGNIYRYRLVMEEHLGRRLTSDEHVHHLNGDRADDRLENLRLVTTVEHARLHQPEHDALMRATWKYEWSLDHPSCAECGTTARKHTGRGLCSRCYFRDRARRIHGHAPRQSATLVTIVCEWCGRERSLTLHENGAKRRYCTRSCASKATMHSRWHGAAR
jgi:hypothetical protein